MTYRLSLVLCGAVALAGCTDPAQFATSSGDQNRTRDGALIGGVLGAAAGLATSDGDNQVRNAAIGAALGAGVGAAVGNALDRQAADLRAQLGDERITVVNTGENLTVTMPQDILFAVDSAELRPTLQQDLRALASNLVAYPASSVDIIGHTDNTGEASYNQDLSARRANAVAGVLTSSGVPASRLRPFGRGEDAPIATNLTPEGQAQNRRVEIIINPTNA